MNDDENYIKQEQISDNGMTDLDIMHDGSTPSKHPDLLSRTDTYTTSDPDLRPNPLDELAMPKYNPYQYEDYGGAPEALPPDTYGNFTNSYMVDGQMMVPTVSDPGFYESRAAGASRNEYALNQPLELPNSGQVQHMFKMGSSPSANSNPRIKMEESEAVDMHGTEEHGASDGYGHAKNDKKPRAKSAHNLIEQRYRNKMNEKFQVLRDSVPVLREYNRASNGSNEEDYATEELGSLGDEHGIMGESAMTPVKKLNKGIILTKSIEYIKYLESKNQRKMMEYQQLLERAEMLGYKVNRD